jgi:hypothetical protein
LLKKSIINPLNEKILIRSHRLFKSNPWTNSMGGMQPFHTMKFHAGSGIRIDASSLGEGHGCRSSSSTGLGCGAVREAACFSPRDTQESHESPRAGLTTPQIAILITLNSQRPPSLPAPPSLPFTNLHYTLHTSCEQTYFALHVLKILPSTHSQI